MRARPFPSGISIGTDICDIRRVRKIITQSHGKLDNFVRRSLTWREANVFHNRFGKTKVILQNGDEQLRGVCHYLASRWAAKEAAIKAVEWRKITASDVEILKEYHGGVWKPYALILDEPAPMSVLEAWQLLEQEQKLSHGAVQESESIREAPEIDTERGTSWEELKNALQHAKFSAHYSTAIEEQESPFQLKNGAGSHAHSSIPHSSRIFDPEGQIARLSISHDGDYAMATCLVYPPGTSS
ncbi:hypothetical protein MBLNU230_g3220t1 [Neophaeotheca triangularis]